MHFSIDGVSAICADQSRSRYGCPRISSSILTPSRCYHYDNMSNILTMNLTKIYQLIDYCSSMHYVSIRRGGAANVSGKYHPNDHFSATDLARGRWKFRPALLVLYVSSRSIYFHLPSRDMIEKGVRRTATAMDCQDPLHSSSYVGHH